MSDHGVGGPIQPGRFLSGKLFKFDESDLKNKKTEGVASQDLGIGSGDSKIQGKAKNIAPNKSSEKFGKAISDFAQSVVRKFVNMKKSLQNLQVDSKMQIKEKTDQKLQKILQDFKHVNGLISDFEERGEPLNVIDADSIMKHQFEVATLRDRLQQIRDQAEIFKDPEVKRDILVVADALMGRLNELLTEKFDAAEFFRVPPPKKQQPDEDLASYFQDTSSQDNLEDLLRELDGIPEGEQPDAIPKAAQEDPFKDLDNDLEEMK